MKRDLVKVQSPSALLKEKILSALWLHRLIKLSPVIKLSVRKTKHQSSVMYPTVRRCRPVSTL